MFSYSSILLTLFHVMLFSITYATVYIEPDSTDNSMKHQCDGSACRSVYQFFGDSSCQPNIKKYIEDAINTLFVMQNKSVESWDESIKRVTEKLEAMEKKIETIGRIGSERCPNGYEYYQHGKFWYKFHNECNSWPKARQVCQQEGGDLISLNERNFDFFRNVSQSKAGDCRHVWVGTTDISSEGQWYWLTGERVSSVFWQSAQPDNAHNNENCGDLISFFEFRLNDHVCSNQEHFICQIV
ncbi:hypothetical protein CHS0354_037086 [Potamilus streckersoni]|uniref:C-type lectin domain-containing protein n=1 Tax=Potamilus streckersoni TaxID=2493646 RepID=A0AAE0VG31_9BIVA|nr:hypothetical protein CHS0354_037086 [Potamilus streckersoni]